MNSISVTMLSRLMLNLQNPLLFDTRSRTHTTGGTGTYVGPFVTTVLERDTVVTSTGPGFSSLAPTSGTVTGTDSSRSGLYSDDLDFTEDDLDAELYARPRNALWYDRAWVSGTSSAVATRNGTRGRVDEAQEDIGRSKLRYSTSSSTPWFQT